MSVSIRCRTCGRISDVGTGFNPDKILCKCNQIKPDNKPELKKQYKSTSVIVGGLIYV